MQCFWTCHSLFEQAKHNLQRLSLVLGLSSQLVQFQHFLFSHLHFICYACSIYFSKRTTCTTNLLGVVRWVHFLQLCTFTSVAHLCSFPWGWSSFTLWADIIPICPTSTEEQLFRNPLEAGRTLPFLPVSIWRWGGRAKKPVAVQLTCKQQSFCYLSSQDILLRKGRKKSPLHLLIPLPFFCSVRAEENGSVHMVGPNLLHGG